MAAYTTRDIFSVSDILSTDRDSETNTISAQLGNNDDEKVISNAAESWQHCGFASRPPNANREIADCPQGISINTDDQDLMIAERDIKSQTIYGQLAAGETCLYAAGEDGDGTARILLKKDGSINLYTKFQNDPGDIGMGIFIDPIKNTISILNATGKGLMIDNDGVKIIGTFVASNLGGGDVRFGNISCNNIKCLSATIAGGPIAGVVSAAPGSPVVALPAVPVIIGIPTP